MKALNEIKIGIIGTAAIGVGWAALFTGNGYPVIVLGRKEAAVFREKYEALYDALEKRNLITGKQRDVCRKFLTYTTAYADLKDVDIVFECVSEDINVKFEVYEKIEKSCENLKVLASATSAISPDDLIKGIKRWPEKILVAHPFNPPHLVPFVELVKSGKTSQEALDLVYAVLESCGRRVCVMKKSAPGFIANRLQHALLREAMYMVDNGLADPEEIDKALMFSFMPRYTSIGIFEHHDAWGMEKLQKLQNYLYPHLSNGQGAADMVVKLVRAGTLGQETGKGIYQWDEKSIADFKVRAADPYWRFFNWNIPPA